jgi:hypothetical protein
MQKDRRLTLRIDGDTLDRLDRFRGERTRSAVVRELIDKARPAPPLTEEDVQRHLDAAVRRGNVAAMKLWWERRRAANRPADPFDEFARHNARPLDEFMRRRNRFKELDAG